MIPHAHCRHPLCDTFCCYCMNQEKIKEAIEHAGGAEMTERTDARTPGQEVEMWRKAVENHANHAGHICQCGTVAPLLAHITTLERAVAEANKMVLNISAHNGEQAADLSLARRALADHQENGGLALRRLSLALTGGNAGTWEQVFEAAESSALAEAHAALAEERKRTNYHWHTIAQWQGERAERLTEALKQAHACATVDPITGECDGCMVSEALKPTTPPPPASEGHPKYGPVVRRPASRRA